MYKNTSSSAFPVSGGTVDSTVFTAVPTGAVNDIVTSFDSKSITDSLSSSNVTINSAYMIKVGLLCVVALSFSPKSTIPAKTNIISGLPRAIRTWNNATTFLAHMPSVGEDTYRLTMRDDNRIGTIETLDQLQQTEYRCTFVYLSNS